MEAADRYDGEMVQTIPSVKNKHERKINTNLTDYLLLRTQPRNAGTTQTDRHETTCFFFSFSCLTIDPAVVVGISLLLLIVVQEDFKKTSLF
jgi:hypothetical protein